MGISDEFKKFGAKQKNIQWSVSAFNDKDELVVSIWGHQPLLVFNKESRIQIYKDKVSRWSGLGYQEFRKNIEIAYLKNGAEIWQRLYSYFIWRIQAASATV